MNENNTDVADNPSARARFVWFAIIVCLSVFLVPLLLLPGIVFSVFGGILMRSVYSQEREDRTARLFLGGVFVVVGVLWVAFVMWGI